MVEARSDQRPNWPAIFVAGVWPLSRGRPILQVVAIEMSKAVVLLHNWLHGFSVF
jgi:hypothetical protein